MALVERLLARVQRRLALLLALQGLGLLALLPLEVEFAPRLFALRGPGQGQRLLVGAAAQTPEHTTEGGSEDGDGADEQGGEHGVR